MNFLKGVLHPQKRQRRKESVIETNEPYPVVDHDAFAAKHMTDLGHEVADFQAYTWKITKWKLLEKKITSPTFSCGGHKWQILFYPSGNSSVPPLDAVSLYLDYADAPKGSHVCAQFAVVMSNPRDPTNFVLKTAHHRFTADESDWGFTRFHILQKLYAPDVGKQPIIENDETVVVVFVRVLVDPTGVLWHNFINYDSKKETGFVGLKNQGATSYMNTLLQLLYCTRAFRKAVYQIPTDNDIPTKSVALALQRVFYNLQTSDAAVDTNELTQSFGWTSLDIFIPHDVLEFSRVLQDKLVTKMKGTPVDGAISKLFAGKMKSYIKCINVPHEAARVEDFYDIQLNVKGLRNLRESFKDYIAVDTLEGLNQYDVQGMGLQDAKKGVIFKSFPDVLHIQLKRFEYDMQEGAMVKLNDRHEFPSDIDLQEFLDEDADKSLSHKYTLFSILVHSGDLHDGHYFALVKPDRGAGWLKFDDDRVIPLTEEEAIEGNYGGEALPVNSITPAAQNTKVPAPKQTTNAYMLIYIRDTAFDTVLAPLLEVDTLHLGRRLEDERIQREAKKREQEAQNLYLTAKVISDKSFTEHQGFDLATLDDNSWPKSDIATFRVQRIELYTSFKRQVAKHFNVPEQQVRLWVLVNRQNKTIRPDTFIPETESNLTVEKVRNTMSSTTVQLGDLRLYLDVWEPSPGKTIPFADLNGHAMVFLKHFDVDNQTLFGVTKHYISRTSKVGDLCGVICERMKWPPQTAVKLYEEIKPGMIELMRQKKTFVQSEIQDGDIICFQAEISDKKINELEYAGLYVTPIQYYDFLQNRVIITFKPRDPNKDKDEFELALSKKMKYEDLAQKVGERLKHESIKLRFTSSTTQGAPKSILKRALNQSVWDIIQLSYLAAQPSILFYERLDVSIVELETKRSLKIIWMGTNNKEEQTLPFLLPKTSSIRDLSDQVLKAVKLSNNTTGKIRVFSITKDGRHQDVFGETEMIGNLPPDIDFYAEEVPRDEIEMRSQDKLVKAFHFSQNPSRAHGVPFQFVARPGEKFMDTKKRLQERVGASNMEFSKYRFALVQSAAFKHPTYLADDDILHNHKFVEGDVLGSDHADNGDLLQGLIKKGIVIKD